MNRYYWDFPSRDRLLLKVELHSTTLLCNARRMFRVWQSVFIAYCSGAKQLAVYAVCSRSSRLVH